MKIKEFYDIVVVGSGPAGGMTALNSAKNGASVLILERDREIGIPVRCAEGMSIRSLSKFFDVKKDWTSNYIDGANLYAPNGKSCSMLASAIGGGIILERRLFDAYICKMAAQYGAEILTKADVYGLIKENGKICGVKFRHFGEERQVSTDIVVGADGAESRIGRMAGLKTALQLSDIHSCAQYLITDIEIDHRYSHFFFGNRIAPGGYIWVFPKGKDTANIGIGIMADKCNGKSAKDFLDKFLEKKFPNGKITSFIAGVVPTSATLKKITSDNLILVGDAAHQVNPVTGGGLSNVLLAGKIAGELAAEAVKKNNFSDKFLQKYHKIWMKEKGNQQKLFYKLKKVFFNFPDEKLNEICDLLNEIPKEKLTLFQLLKTAIKEKPRLVKELIKCYF